MKISTLKCVGCVHSKWTTLGLPQQKTCFKSMLSCFQVFCEGSIPDGGTSPQGLDSGYDLPGRYELSSIPVRYG